MVNANDGNRGKANMPVYKACEKRWKPMSEEDLLKDEELIDVLNLSDAQKLRVKEIGTFQWDENHEPQPVLAFDAFGDIHKGFFVIPNAFNPQMQLDIAYKSLNEYTEEPHRTNMHSQNEHVPQIWRKARAKHALDPSKSKVLSKLHWAASGYHYDWTARKYYKDQYSDVPSLLIEIGENCAAACGMSLVAEAVIVNFYKKSSTMGGHQDDVEYTMDHPVVSLSLGSRCVFLKGGLTKDDKPLQVLLRSGDVAIMGGASRLSFHGVARILPTSFTIEDEAWQQLLETIEDPDKQEEMHAIRTYLSQHRININIRQVYPLEQDQTTPESTNS